MKITIAINCDNDAFQEHGTQFEVARILRELSDNLEARGTQDIKLRDLNGNTVGEMSVEEDQEDRMTQDDSFSPGT